MTVSPTGIALVVVVVPDADVAGAGAGATAIAGALLAEVAAGRLALAAGALAVVDAPVGPVHVWVCASGIDVGPNATWGS